VLGRRRVSSRVELLLREVVPTLVQYLGPLHLQLSLLLSFQDKLLILLEDHFMVELDSFHLPVESFFLLGDVFLKLLLVLLALLLQLIHALDHLLLGLVSLLLKHLLDLLLLQVQEETLGLQVSNPLFLPLLHVVDAPLHPHLNFLELLHAQIHLLLIDFLLLLLVEVLHGQVLIILLLGLLC